MLTRPAVISVLLALYVKVVMHPIQCLKGERNASGGGRDGMYHISHIPLHSSFAPAYFGVVEEKPFLSEN